MLKLITEKKTEYSWDFCKTSPPENISNERGIEVLATWYLLSRVGQFHVINGINSFYINIKSYIISVNSSLVSSDGMRITLDKAMIVTLKQKNRKGP